MELSNKELAFLITIALFFLWCSYKNIDCLIQLIKATFSPKLAKLYLVVLIYFITITYLLYQINLWNYLLLKTSVVWVLSTGILTVFSTIEKKEVDIRKVITKSFIISLFVNYILGFSNYNLLIEVFLLWLVIFLSLCIVILQNDKQLKRKPGIDKLEKLIFIILTIIFFNNFINGVLYLIENRGDEFSIQELVLPFLYTLAYRNGRCTNSSIKIHPPLFSIRYKTPFIKLLKKDYRKNNKNQFF